MNCRECRDYIDPYFDSELDAGDAIQVKHHLRDCPECLQRLRSREALSGLLCNPELKFEIPKTLPGKIKSKIRLLADGASGGFTRRPTSPWIYVPLGLAAAMALLFGLLFLNRSRLVERYSASLVDEVVAGHVRSMLATHLLD